MRNWSTTATPSCGRCPHGQRPQLGVAVVLQLRIRHNTGGLQQEAAVLVLLEQEALVLVAGDHGPAPTVGLDQGAHGNTLQVCSWWGTYTQDTSVPTLGKWASGNRPDPAPRPRR